jgi:hypothetical protein
VCAGVGIAAARWWRVCAGEGVAAAPDEGDDTAAVEVGDTGWLIDVPDEEQALPIPPMMINMTMARQPHPAAC